MPRDVILINCEDLKMSIGAIQRSKRFGRVALPISSADRVYARRNPRASSAGVRCTFWRCEMYARRRRHLALAPENKMHASRDGAPVEKRTTAPKPQSKSDSRNILPIMHIAILRDLLRRLRGWSSVKKMHESRERPRCEKTVHRAK